MSDKHESPASGILNLRTVSGGLHEKFLDDAICRRLALMLNGGVKKAEEVETAQCTESSLINLQGPTQYDAFIVGLSYNFTTADIKITMAPSNLGVESGTLHPRGTVTEKSNFPQSSHDLEIPILELVGEEAHPVDPNVEKRVLRKIDMFLMPAMLIGKRHCEHYYDYPKLNFEL